MKTRAILALLSFPGVLIAAPAHAASGGSTLPFNDALTLIQDNLTGPTANTIIVVIIVAALVTVATGRDDSWVKPSARPSSSVPFSPRPQPCRASWGWAPPPPSRRRTSSPLSC